MTYNREQPYNALPDLPPKVNLETIATLKKNITASRALAQLNGSLQKLPNPFLFIDTLHLKEAKASSEIENIITTNDELYQSIIGDKKLNNLEAKEVLRYKDALWLGIKKLEDRPFLTTNLFIEIVQLIKNNTAGIRKTTGTSLKNNEGIVIYTPPEGEKIIREKLGKLETFINNDNNLDPLIKMAVMHYQFEAIHPFFDGNGRTGRILMLLYLKLAGLLDHPILFFSEYIIQNKSDYYANLREITEQNNWENWVMYMLDMVEKTANRGIELINKVNETFNQLNEDIKSELPKLHSKELVETLFSLPYLKRQVLVNKGFGTLKTTGNYLNALEKKGFLNSKMIGKEKIYINSALLKLL